MQSKSKKSLAGTKEDVFQLPSDWWKRLHDLVNDEKQIALTKFLFKNPHISDKTLRRSKESGEISKGSLRKLALSLGDKYDWKKVLEALGGKPPVQAPTKQSRFRDVHPQFWQPMWPSERPRPFPPMANELPPPFQRKLAGNFIYAAGWGVRLEANLRYHVTCDFVRNKVWPEVEIVLYERVSNTELWKRAESFGAVTKQNDHSAEITPQIEEYLITAWGKNVIGDTEPWYNFVPDSSFHEGPQTGLIRLPFFPANTQANHNKFPAPPISAESSPVVTIQAME